MTHSQSAEFDLTEGSVRGHIMRMAVPVVWGLIAMMSINVVDTWFVSTLGTRELAAMSFTFPVVLVVSSLGIGLMAGTSSVIARFIGSGDRVRVRCLATDSILFTIILSTILTITGLAVHDPLFRALGAPEDMLPLIYEYMLPWFLGLVVFLAPMTAMGAIRATGDAKLQGRLMGIAALINLILDPLLIFGWLGFPELGLAGAAIASVIARAVSVWMGVVAMGNRDLLVFESRPLDSIMDSWHRMLHVGLPAAGTNMIIPLANGVLLAMVASYGSEAVAGYGAASRIEALAMVIFFALSAVIGPFVGQNLGAGRTLRIREARREAAWLCVMVGAVTGVLLIVFAQPLVALFSDETSVVEQGATYLTIIPLSFAPAGIVMVMNASFNGIGKPLPGVIISCVRMFLVMIPLAWIGGRLFGLAGLYSGLAIANVVAAAIAYKWFDSVIAKTQINRV